MIFKSLIVYVRGKKKLIITDFGEAESESIPLKITESRGGGERFPVIVRAHSQGSPESVITRYDQNFFYDPTQRHGDHREKTVPSGTLYAVCKTAQKKRKIWNPHESYHFQDSRSLSGPYRRIPHPAVGYVSFPIQQHRTLSLSRQKVQKTVNNTFS